MYILSIDFGTSSLKLSILNKEINIVKEVKEEYQYNVIDNDKVEIDPNLMFNALINGMKKIDKKYMINIEVIAFDVLSPSLVTLDENGDPIYPCILHLDRRSYKQSRDVAETMGVKIFQNITGVLPFAGGVSITSLLWLKENVPNIYNGAYMFGHFNTFIYKKLTGKWAIDPVNASMTGMYETTKWGGWSEDILRAFNILRAKLPDILEVGTLGVLQKDAASVLGLKEGLPVILGCNDAATAIVGAGNEKEGDILNISGSNEVGCVLTEKPIVNDAYYLRNSPYTKKWQLFSVNIGGFAIEWFRETAFRDMTRDYFYNEYLTDLVDRFELERYNYSTVRCQPYFAGDRHSLEQKRGMFSGITLSTTRDEMLTALLMGISEPLMNNLKISGHFVKLNKRIIITEGLARTAYVKFKQKILPGFEFEFKERCTTIGNGILALQALEKLR